jgi:hypothetical protein
MERSQLFGEPRVDLDGDLPSGSGQALLDPLCEYAGSGAELEHDGRARPRYRRRGKLSQPDQALVRVQVSRSQGERVAAPAGGLGVQPQQQAVQGRVATSGGRDLV